VLIVVGETGVDGGKGVGVGLGSLGCRGLIPVWISVGFGAGVGLLMGWISVRVVLLVVGGLVGVWVWWWV